jgi:hypothetical protein
VRSQWPDIGRHILGCHGFCLPHMSPSIQSPDGRAIMDFVASPEQYCQMSTLSPCRLRGFVAKLYRKRSLVVASELLRRFMHNCCRGDVAISRHMWQTKTMISSYVAYVLLPYVAELKLYRAQAPSCCPIQLVDSDVIR